MVRLALQIRGHALHVHHLLRHRLHDLRRPPLQRALQLRHVLAQSVRRRGANAD